MCCWQSARGIIWSAWGIVNLIGIIYFALSFSVFNNILQAYYKINEDTMEIFTILAITFFCNFSIVLFGVLSFLMLLCKSVIVQRAGFTYGFLSSSAANLGLLLLLCGLMLSGFADEVRTKFEKDKFYNIHWGVFDTKMYQLDNILAYITAAAYLGLFGVMMVMSTSVGERVQTTKVVSKKPEA